MYRHPQFRPQFLGHKNASSPHPLGQWAAARRLLRNAGGPPPAPQPTGPAGSSIGETFRRCYYARLHAHASDTNATDVAGVRSCPLEAPGGPRSDDQSCAATSTR